MSEQNETIEQVTMESVSHILDAVATCGGVEPSLKAIALTLNVAPTRVYAVAKKPIPGQVYDPDATNFDSVSAFVAGKIGQNVAAEGESEVVYTSMEQFVEAAIAKDEWLKENDGRKVSTAANNLIEVDGNMMPKRKAAMFEMGDERESLICFKKDENVYKIVYQTMGYTCLRAVNADGSFAKEEVRVISNATLNTKCVSPSLLPQSIADRFSGEYAARMSAETPDAE